MKVFFNQKKHDYPKKINDVNLAWYQQGRICIMRNLRPHIMQEQNNKIKIVNKVSRQLWDVISKSFKKDLALYALAYKKTYPGLRKRGISSYGIMLMLVHGLIKRFSLQSLSEVSLYETVLKLISHLTVYKSVKLNLLRKLVSIHSLNHTAIDVSDSNTIPFQDDMTDNIQTVNVSVVKILFHAKRLTIRESHIP